jgi:hypothetical protein
MRRDHCPVSSRRSFAGMNAMTALLLSIEPTPLRNVSHPGRLEQL